MVPENWNAQLVSSKPGGRGVLDELTSALGLDVPDPSRLGLRVAGQRVDLRVELVDGVAQAVLVTARFEGPRPPAGESDEPAPSILLRREQTQDRRDKTRGLTREVQTGFQGFDHAVFIDADASDDDVRRILSKEATRQAVLRLLDEGHFAVRISTTGVTVKHPLEGGHVDVERLLAALEDLLIVARAGGPRGTASTKRGELLLGVAVGGCTLMAAYAFLAWSAWTTSLLVAGIGVVVGGAAALFSRPSVEAACAGDSGSGKRSAAVVALVGVAAAALTFGALVHANGALDRSEGEEWRGVIVDVWHGKLQRSAERGQQRITVRWRDGSSSTCRWSGFAEQGDHFSEVRHRGALGFEWVDAQQVVSRR